jgi:hypothetical protein
VRPLQCHLRLETRIPAVQYVLGGGSVRLTEQGRQQLLGELLDLQSGGELSGWDEEFVDDMILRLAAARDGATLSEKQYAPRAVASSTGARSAHFHSPPARPRHSSEAKGPSTRRFVQQRSVLSSACAQTECKLS